MTPAFLWLGKSSFIYVNPGQLFIAAYPDDKPIFLLGRCGFDSVEVHIPLFEGVVENAFSRCQSAIFT